MKQYKTGMYIYVSRRNKIMEVRWCSKKNANEHGQTLSNITGKKLHWLEIKLIGKSFTPKKKEKTK